MPCRKRKTVAAADHGKISKHFCAAATTCLPQREAETIHFIPTWRHGLLRFARHDR
jgi:hypothetical protein